MSKLILVLCHFFFFKIEDKIIKVRGDMKFLFESVFLDMKLNTKRKISCLQAAMYYFYEDFGRFSNILRILSEDCTNVSNHFPKNSENFRGRSKDVLILDQRLLTHLTFNKGKQGN